LETKYLKEIGRW